MWHCFNYFMRFENGNIIGKGEDTALELLAQLFPQKSIKRQVKLSELLKKDWADDLSERQKKETIDLVVYTNPVIVVRVQDPHHNGIITAERDLVQRKTLEWNNIKVVDLRNYDCINIMKEENNREAMRELLEAFKYEGIT